MLRSSWKLGLIFQIWIFRHFNNLLFLFAGVLQKISNKGSKCCESPCNLLLSIFPIFQWLPKYNWRSDFSKDVVSGLTVGILHIPQGTYQYTNNNTEFYSSTSIYWITWNFQLDSLSCRIHQFIIADFGENR